MKFNLTSMRRMFLCVSLFPVLSACQDEFVEDADLNQEGAVALSDGTLKLGKKITNPYSLKIMQQAFDELGGTRSGGNLQPTHLYLKFSPKNVEQLRLLESDTSLFFYNYPLDVELIGEGGDYHDPSLPDSVPTYQYVCAPINYKLPDVEHEVLDEIYLEEDGVSSSLRSASAISWESLEEKACLIAGDTAKPSETRGSKWYADGYLKYEDTELGVVPLVGVQVRMRYHIATHTNVTNENGYFKSPVKLRSDCKYSIEWKRGDNFKIRPVSGLATADYVIQNNHSSVNKTFSKSDNATQWYYASIFRGAKFCYYDDIAGLSRPEGSLEMRASNRDDGTAVGDYSTYGSTEIHIYRYDSNGRERNSMQIYGTTVHELAHSIHCRVVGKSTFRDVSKSVKEAWTVGVANYFTYDKYKQFSRIWYDGIYSGLVDDLIDNDARGLWTCSSYVSGYTLLQVQNALKGAKTWSSFKANIKKIKNNSTENGKIDQLFAHWYVSE